MEQEPAQPAAAPAWQPIGARLRRVAGVLVEKAKTTPDAYPLSLNAIVTGSNQKSNRDPVMTLDAEQADEALEQLRSLGAVIEVHGDGRVPRYRHTLYEWLGVEKVELSIMAELLLRGPQTLGDLRGRAARMDPIADVAELKPLVDGLMTRGLVIALTPPGRGQIVTHNLYLPPELEKIRQRIGHTGPIETPEPARNPAPSAAPPSASTQPTSTPPAASAPTSFAATTGSGPAASPVIAVDLTPQLEQLRSELSELRTLTTELQSQLEEVRAAAEQNADEIRRLTDQLGG